MIFLGPARTFKFLSQQKICLGDIFIFITFIHAALVISFFQCFPCIDTQIDGQTNKHILRSLETGVKEYASGVHQSILVIFVFKLLII